MISDSFVISSDFCEFSVIFEISVISPWFLWFFPWFLSLISTRIFHYIPDFSMIFLWLLWFLLTIKVISVVSQRFLWFLWFLWFLSDFYITCTWFLQVIYPLNLTIHDVPNKQVSRFLSTTQDACLLPGEQQGFQQQTNTDMEVLVGNFSNDQWRISNCTGKHTP